jgi:hypothetical protein
VTRDRKVIDAALQRKGFQKDDSNHHYYIYRNLDGKKTMKKTMMSHGSSSKTIGDPLLGKMAKQVGLTKKSFLELVDCTLDQERYETLILPKAET